MQLFQNQDNILSGYCAKCGEDILAERLAVDPVSEICVKCAA